jgi:hypothetical protein
MNGIRHPFTRALYELDADGAIRVTLDGSSGRFTSEGRWISGELREADPQLCGWVGGPRVESNRTTSPSNGHGAP